MAIDRNGQVIPGSVHGHAPSAELATLHEQLRTDLTAILRDKLDGRNLRRLTAAAAKMEITPKFEVDSQGKLVSTYRYVPEGPAAAIAYGTLLMADEGRPFRKDMKQCRLEGCGRFFFSSDSPAATGRDRSRFCTPEHMEQHHKSTSAERVRRFRERLARKHK